MNLIKTLESLGATTAQRMLVLLELYERGPIATNDFQSAATGFTREMLMVFEAEETVESALITGKRKDGRIWRLTDKAFSAIAGALGTSGAKPSAPMDQVQIITNWLWLYNLRLHIRHEDVTICRDWPGGGASIVHRMAIDLDHDEPLTMQANFDIVLEMCREAAQICGIAPPILEL